jgi:hypothetical protein
MYYTQGACRFYTSHLLPTDLCDPSARPARLSYGLSLTLEQNLNRVSILDIEIGGGLIIQNTVPVEKQTIPSALLSSSFINR